MRICRSVPLTRPCAGRGIRSGPFGAREFERVGANAIEEGFQLTPAGRDDAERLGDLHTDCRGSRRDEWIVGRGFMRED